MMVDVCLAELNVSWSMEVHASDDEHISVQIAASGVWEPFETELVARLLQVASAAGRPLFVDCGANIGWFTLLAAELGVDVVAFEPTPANAALLRRNVATNGLDGHVAVHECALGAEAGMAELHLSPTNQGDHRLHQGVSWNSEKLRKSIGITVATLDEVLAGRRPAVIKIDTQGSETLILRGGARSWRPRAGVADVALVSEFWPYGLQRCGSSAKELLELLVPLIDTTHACFNIVEWSRTLEPLTADGLLKLADAPYLSLTNRGFANLLFVPMSMEHSFAETATPLVGLW